MKCSRRIEGIRRPATDLTLVLSLFALSLIPAFAVPPPKPDFGPNVLIFNPSMPSSAIQQQIDTIYSAQQNSEFGSQRNAILFTPGNYNIDIPIGFYTEVIGLGSTPDAVHISGNVHADATLPHDNATCTFWRAAEGFSVTPTGGTMRWAVSQAAPFRRMHVLGDLVLNQNYGWASGGWISDSLIDGNVGSGSQQQWISRNSEWGSWTGANWNMVFVGIPKPPAGDWPTPPYTKISQTPIVREKPFLQADALGQFSVHIPSLVTNGAGITWHRGSTPGHNIPLEKFYIAHPETDTAATINAQLDAGRHLLLTPGIYELTEPIRLTRPGEVVLGLGYATLRPINGTAAITTADVDGIIIAGLLIDAGPISSPVLLQVGPNTGPAGSRASHAKNPISLHDVFFRVGGAGPGRAVVNLEINSNDTIIDHTWIWRADHGAGAGWTTNLSANGLVVNGNNVTAYGLFVEHFQQFQVLWNGNNGRTYFYQSEIPYDPPDQPVWTSAAGTNGWASYKVADSVTNHEAWGLGIYSVFRYPNVDLSRAIEVPSSTGVRFHHMISIALANLGEISNVINNAGGPTSTKPLTTPKVADFP